MNTTVLKRVLAFILSLVLCFGMSSCGKNKDKSLSPTDETASSSEKHSEDIPEEVEEEEPEDENIYIQEPVNSVPNYEDVEKEILSQQASKPAETDEKNKEKDKKEETDIDTQVDKSVYTGKDYGDTPITKENLNFDGKTVTIMREWAPYESGVSTVGDLFLAKVSKLEKQFNVKIAQKKWKVNLVAEMLSGTASEGHLYMVDSASGGSIYDMASKGYIAYMDDAMKATGINMTSDRYNKFNTGINNIGGKQWTIGVGFSNINTAVLYNKKLMQSAGYDVNGLINSKQWTWDKITEIAKLTTKRNESGEVTQWGIGMGTSGIKAMVLSNGGHLSHPDSDGKFVSCLNSENTKEALGQVYNWYNVDRVATAFTGGVWSSGNSAFANGKVAVYFADQTAVKSAFTNLKAEDYGVAYLPLGPKATKYVSYMTVGCSYVVPAQYQKITTELLLLVDELHSRSEGYTLENQFKDEWRSSFHTDEQYNIWYSMHFDSNMEAVWEGSDFVDLAGTTGVGLESIMNGSMIASVWADTNHAIYTTNADILAEKYKYTGSLK